MLRLLRRALIVTVFGWTKYKLSLLKLLAYYPNTCIFPYKTYKRTDINH